MRAIRQAVLAVAAAAVAAAAAAPAAADFAAGAEAYDGGDYQTAFAEWHLLARGGDAEAQTAIAGLYRFGAGREVDLAESARWYHRSAAQGEPVAQLNLGEMYMLGFGVPRDDVRAYLWLSLAANQGRSWAAERRDAVARRLNDDQLARGRAMVRAWRPSR